ncbi:replication protein [Virgibacillus halodenitrificans]|nr:replication protein [Virgibacillus halodenitrificans]
MASPQTKNGYTRIANELLDQIIKVNLNGTQFRLVMAVWRYTYGFQAKEKELSIRFLAEKTEANKRQVERELKSLIDKNIVITGDKGERGARMLSVNKDYEKWGEVEKTKSAAESPKPKKKTNIKPKYSEDNTYYKMATYFYTEVSRVAEEAGVPHLTKKANMQSWSDDMRKLIEIDQVNKQLAKDVMDWVVQDSFWKTNVLSAKKLREKFAELAIKMNAQKKPVKPKQEPDSRDKDIAFQQFVADGGDPSEFNWNS